MRWTAMILVALAAAFSGAQEPTLELKGDVVVVKVAKVITIMEDRTVLRTLPGDLYAPKGGAGYWWSVPPGVAFTDNGDSIKITAAPKGELTVKVKVLAVDFDKKITTNTTYGLTFNIGDAGPLPPPIPPVPPPVPPVPPAPNPSPFPAVGLRVLVVYEATKGAAILTPKQATELYSKAMADYLNSHCVKEGTQPGWRFWDKDTPIAGAAKIWQDAMAMPRANIPWLIVGDGVKGFSVPLPDGGILAKIQEVGGP